MSDLMKITKPSTEAEKTTRTTLDTLEVTPDLLKSWKLPPFQRPLRVNDKIIDLAKTIKENGEIIPGVMTIGIHDKVRYLLDGQHRREAFLISGCAVGYVDVRIAHYSGMAEMAQEYVNLNSRLVSMRPDDILRGLESVYPALHKIRQSCPFVGYDMVRRGDRSPLVSMSALLRCWFSSATEAPSVSTASTTALVNRLTDEEVSVMVGFMNMAINAWGRDAEYHRLWLALNLTVCMWLYRNMVITAWSPKTVKLSRDVFTKCLMSVSANPSYLDWLVGRKLGDRDRAPCYGRIKVLFANRLLAETGNRPLLPAPPWASHAVRAASVGASKPA